MTARNAWKTAWRTFCARPGDTFCFLLLETVLRLIVLCPLIALTSPGLKWLAVLTPVLFVLITLPARQKSAAVMQDALRGKPLFDSRLILGSGYGKALLRGVKQALIMLLWFLPCIAATAYLYYMYTGGADAFTILRMLSSLGGGEIVRGTVIVGVVYVLTFIPGLFGLAFHSGRRHELALTGKVIRGRRGLVLRSWLIGLVTVIPFAIAFALLASDYVLALRDAVSAFMSTMTLALPPVSGKVWLIAAAFAVLMLPLMPFKSLISAAAVHGIWEEKSK